jgi:hypothetical protein
LLRSNRTHNQITLNGMMRRTASEADDAAQDEQI